VEKGWTHAHFHYHTIAGHDLVLAVVHPLCPRCGQKDRVGIPGGLKSIALLYITREKLDLSPLRQNKCKAKKKKQNKVEKADKVKP